MNTDNWVNDMIYTCDNCGKTFKVYFKEEETTQFCPSCASRNLSCYEEE